MKILIFALGMIGMAWGAEVEMPVRVGIVRCVS